MLVIHAIIQMQPAVRYRGVVDQNFRMDEGEISPKLRKEQPVDFVVIRAVFDQSSADPARSGGKREART